MLTYARKTLLLLITILALLPSRQSAAQSDNASIEAFAWSPNGEQIAIVYLDGLLEIRNSETMAVQKTVPIGQLLIAVAWSPDGKRIAVAGRNPSRNGMVAIYTLATEQITQLIPPRPSGNLIGLTPTFSTRVAWRPDGRYIAASVAIGEGPDLFQRLFIFDAISGEKVHEVDFNRDAG
jgi:WD40 repeat protein